MSRLILATSCNEGYMHRAGKFLGDIDKHSQVENYFLGLDFSPSVELKIWCDQVMLRDIKSSELRLPPNNACIQHGEFIDYIPGEPEDVIIFTDADLRMQRPFSDAELAWLEGFEEGQIGVGYNAGPTDTLLDEARRLGMKVPVQELNRLWTYLDTPCYNWGCVVATRETWAILCKRYIELFGHAQNCFNHVAKQQWLLSWLTAWHKPVEMALSFHAHKHYGVPPGCEYKGGKLYVDGELGLFSHRFDR